MRKLATVRKIGEITSIEGADKIEVAHVDGWECVIAKNDGFKVGDKIIYVEIDSVMPEKPEFEFLRSRKFRVRTIKLRGQVSQGLVLSMSVLPADRNYEVGDDVTEILGVTKYDPQAVQEQEMANSTENKPWIYKKLMHFSWFRKLQSEPKKTFPGWIVKTDEERIQNKTEMFEREKALGTKFSVTEKIDGQSGTFFYEKKGRKFGVCSRNIQLKKNNSSYWNIAEKYKIKDCLKELIGEHKRIVLQGEILGTGIQGNKYKIAGYDIYAFNLIADGKKFTTEEMAQLLKPYGIKTVPVVETDFTLKDTVQDMVEYAKGKSVLVPKQKREGVVIRNYERNISFKVINPDFLLAEKDDE